MSRNLSLPPHPPFRLLASPRELDMQRAVVCSIPRQLERRIHPLISPLTVLYSQQVHSFVESRYREPLQLFFRIRTVPHFRPTPRQSSRLFDELDTYATVGIAQPDGEREA